MLDLTKPVRTRDGRKVEIYAVKEANGTHPVIGAFLDSERHWIAGSWTSAGEWFPDFSNHPSDLMNVDADAETEPDIKLLELALAASELRVASMRAGYIEIVRNLHRCLSVAADVLGSEGFLEPAGCPTPGACSCVATEAGGAAR
jgi:hypothetical protein